MKWYALAIPAACVLGLAAGSAQALTYNKTVLLTGGAEVPPVTSPGFGAGNVTMVLDTVTNTMNFTVLYAGLSSPVTFVSLNGPATSGFNGPQLLNLSQIAGSTATPITATTTISSAIANLIFSGQTYINVNTTSFPIGEVRGYLPAGQTPAIPEPAALGLLGLGIGGLALRLRKRALAG